MTTEACIFLARTSVKRLKKSTLIAVNDSRLGFWHLLQESHCQQVVARMLVGKHGYSDLIQSVDYRMTCLIYNLLIALALNCAICYAPNVAQQVLIPLRRSSREKTAGVDCAQRHNALSAGMELSKACSQPCFGDFPKKSN